MATPSTVPTRRALLGAASAFAGGALVVAQAAATLLTANDPLPALVAERNRLWAMTDPKPAGMTDREFERFIDQIDEADEGISARVVETTATTWW